MNLDCQDPTPHTHKTETGMIVKCYHHCRSVFGSVGFWIGMTVGFPVEHYLWTKVPGFSHISAWLGLM